MTNEIFSLIDPNSGVLNRLKVYKGEVATIGIACRHTLENNTIFHKDVAIISIRTHADEQYKASKLIGKGHVNDILFLRFADLDTETYKLKTLDEKELALHDIKLIDKPQAIEIIKFAVKNIDKPIICQCEAGISRSAGVASALSVIFNGDDEWVFNDKHYHPNRHVRSMVMNTFFNVL